VKYIVTYKYEDPSSAGPFRGRMTFNTKMDKGDTVWGPFGRATVVSCRQLREEEPPMLAHIQDRSAM
jgi:hypothetical protein